MTSHAFSKISHAWKTSILVCRQQIEITKLVKTTNHWPTSSYLEQVPCVTHACNQLFKIYESTNSYKLQLYNQLK